MKKFILSIALTGLISYGFAQTLPSLQVSSVINTGIKDLDENLNVINAIATESPELFKQELASSFSAKPEVVQTYMDGGLKPAEVYLAYQTADITQQPVNKVVDGYKKSKGKGWGRVAQDMGIKPGSDEFFALKNKVKEKKEKMNKGREENGKKEEKDDKDKGKDKDKTSKGKEDKGTKGKGKKTK